MTSASDRNTASNAGDQPDQEAVPDPRDRSTDSGAPAEPKGEAVVRVVQSLSEIAARDFDACSNPDPATYNPFLSHAFLEALENAGCVSADTGWLPNHLALEDNEGRLLGIAPAYLKSHSQGEFVFDYAWADAYERAGGDYYPKLQVSVPFTPVPGPRLLIPPGDQAAARERILAAASVELTRRLGLSSVHMTFLEKDVWDRLGEMGFLQRMDQQFHFANPGYETFEAFLDTLASRKRKEVRKERARAVADAISIEHVTGAELTEAHWDAFYEFYLETGSRKWGAPYLNREFFSLIGERIPERCLLVMAKRGGRYVAGALNMIGGDCLYGRYWGAIEHHPCLHFEVCYYQAIDYAIAHGLPRVEAGAQGQHKLARGYVPQTTYSAHWFSDRGLSEAVARYLVAERRQVARAGEILGDYAPFKKQHPKSGD